MLTRISIRSYEDKPDAQGFDVEKVETYWVYRLGEDNNVTQERWEKRQTKGGVVNRAHGDGITLVSEPELITGANGQPLGRLPFHWLSLDPLAKVGEPGIPPFMGLTDKLIRLFNMESELDAIQRSVNIPIPKQGWPHKVPSEPEDVPLSRDFVWHYQAGGDVGFAEPQGSGMAISDQRIQRLKEEIRAEQEKYITQVSQTATAALLDSGQTQMTMQWFSNAVESAFEELFKLWKLMSDPSFDASESAGGIKISLKIP